MAKILVIDDNESTRTVLTDFFSREGFSIETSDCGKHGLEMLDKNYYDLIITDMKMQDVDGLAVIKEAKKKSPTTEIILITAYGTIETAVKAIKEGAYDYISKPFEMDEILITINRALERKKLSEKVDAFEKDLKERYNFEGIIGNSPQMIDVLTTVTKVCPTDSTVLITGESGTGKELVAKAIHYNSPRHKESLVVLNCGAIPENLHESELFGHKKGSFTGASFDKKGLIEEAHEGTIILDEVGELSKAAQVKLLRFLQNKEIRRVGETQNKIIDARVVAMTNRNLKDEIVQGYFREDLFFRLNVIPIHIPPLRERRSDISILINHFLKIYAEKLHKPLFTISRRALSLLVDYNWPGNVRELENLIERLMILCDSTDIDAQSLPQEIRKDMTTGIDSPLDKRLSLAELEKRYIVEVLNSLSWNKKQAVEWLGISRSTLFNKLKQYGLDEHN